MKENISLEFILRVPYVKYDASSYFLEYKEELILHG